ncbi:hypothetical protein JHK87_027624 [Glycine soja]|nr:hypothetical protein JHK87_027624 [Glycine soja]
MKAVEEKQWQNLEMMKQELKKSLKVELSHIASHQLAPIEAPEIQALLARVSTKGSYAGPEGSGLLKELLSGGDDLMGLFVVVVVGPDKPPSKSAGEPNRLTSVATDDPLGELVKKSYVVYTKPMELAWDGAKFGAMKKICSNLQGKDNAPPPPPQWIEAKDQFFCCATLIVCRSAFDMFLLGSFNPPQPSHILVQEIIGKAPQSFLDGDDAYRNSRFKLIPYICKDLFPSGIMVFLMQSVGKKAYLVGQALEMLYIRGKNYQEIDIDVGSSTVARGVPSLLLGYLNNLVVEMAFLDHRVVSQKKVCSICGHRIPVGLDKTSIQVSAFPSAVLPEFLYLGSYDNASRLELLKTQGISRILNTVPSCQNLYKNSFTYHCLPDDKTLPFDEAIQFLVLGLLQRLEHPVKADGSLSLMVIGDWGRKGTYNQSQVATQMGRVAAKLNIDFVISTGDNFYDDGLTVLGNHDYRGDVEAQLNPILRKIDPRWICQRSFIVDTGKDLEIALKDSTAKWKIVVGHHPIRSIGHHGDTKELIRQLLPILEMLIMNLMLCDVLIQDSKIEQCEKDKERVLVHCMSGKSRSLAIVIAYLMKSKVWRLVHSYQWVKERRPSVELTQAACMTWELAESGDSFITSIINGADLVPTIHWGRV